LNPIEHAFANLKALLRSAAARTIAALWHTIGQLLDAFTPAEWAHYSMRPPDRIPRHSRATAACTAVDLLGRVP
jgi:hypothetical protein